MDGLTRKSARPKPCQSDALREMTNPRDAARAACGRRDSRLASALNAPPFQGIQAATPT
jgi:hypothetical protein